MTYLIIPILLLLVSCGSELCTVKCRLVETLPSPSVNTESEKPDYLHIAYRFYNSREYDSTLVYLYKAYSENRDRWEVSYVYALTGLATGDFSSAEEYCYRALSINDTDKPDRAKIYTVLGLVCEQTNRPANARQHYLTALRLDTSAQAAREGLARTNQLSNAQ